MMAAKAIGRQVNDLTVCAPTWPCDEELSLARRLGLIRKGLSLAEQKRLQQLISVGRVRPVGR